MMRWFLILLQTSLRQNIKFKPMSTLGLIVAKQYGSGLPAFPNEAEAAKSLLSLRDTTLKAFTTDYGQQLNIDYTPESLKSLEKWYIQNSWPKFGESNYSLPLALGFYFGEVLCKNCGFEWIVKEFVFRSGRYEIGVRRGRMSIMLTKGKLPRIKNNIRMESFWRAYKQNQPVT
jgi:hypothetical protein